MKLIIFLGLILFISTLGHSEESEIVLSQKNTSYNICDELLQNSDFFIFAYDDWGFKGTLHWFGLPSTVLKIKYNEMPDSDPLYGQIPFAWMNSRFSSLKVDGKAGVCNYVPFWPKTRQTISRFNYYRGDYGFLNFGLTATGFLSDKTRWRFSGENFAYDGQYGLYGPQQSKLGESLSQSYRFNSRTKIKNWWIDTGVAYQKYTAGVSDANIIESQGKVKSVTWSFGGRNKEYRTTSYLKACSRRDKDSTIAAIQVSSIIYRNSFNNLNFSFQGEASQFSAILRREIYFEKHKVSISALPLAQTVYFKGGFKKKQSVLRVSLRDSCNMKSLSYHLQVGTANSNWTTSANIAFLNSNNINIGFLRDFSLYPAIYCAPFGGLKSLFPEKDGFTYSICYVNLNVKRKILYSQTGFKRVKSDFLVPFMPSNLDTIPEYIKEHLNSFYLTEYIKITLPWKCSVEGRAIFTPAKNKANLLQIQSWGRALQELYLFNNNLHLYISGEVIYQDGGNNLGWIEVLRQSGQLGAQFFTNNRLAFTTRFGAHIGDFHIFYVIYNIEDRKFSTIPLMPYRNRLKVLGIEWSFID